MNDHDDGRDLESWSAEELDALLRDAIEDRGMPMENDVDVLGIKFTISSIDHGETERVMRSTRDLSHDLITREIVNQKRLLAESISRINGRPTSQKALTEFLDKAPPPVVTAIYSAFLQLRIWQDSRIAGVAAALGKEQASTTSESSGNSVEG